jgi:hypothetical protein
MRRFQFLVVNLDFIKQAQEHLQSTGVGMTGPGPCLEIGRGGHLLTVLEPRHLGWLLAVDLGQILAGQPRRGQ